MAYTISNNANGSFTINPGTLNTTSTSLTLIGSNVTGFGNILNQNSLNLLVNSAGTSSPANPLIGQLWFDSGNNVLRYYDTTHTWNAFPQLTKNTGTATATDPYTYGRLPYHAIPIGCWFNAGTWDANANHVLQAGTGLSSVDTNTSLLSNGQQIIDISYNGTYMIGISSHPDYQTVSAEGNVYRCIVAGTTNLDGFNQWDVGDLAVCVMGQWVKVTVNFNNVSFGAGTF